MTVLHLVKTSVGADWALRQLRELTRAGVNCHVVLPEDSGLAGEYRSAGITTHFIPIQRPPTPWNTHFLARSLRVVAQKVRPDIVHSHFVATTLLMRYALRDIACPRVFQVPGPLHLENPLTARLELATAGAMDYWIASCQWTQDQYCRLGISADRVFLAHYGCDVETMQPPSPGTLRAELGVEDETSLVGMVAYCYRPKAYLGARRGIKGHEDFIDAIGVLRRKGFNVIGVIVGGPWKGAETYFAKVRWHAEANRDTHVLFLGTRHDIPQIYADLSVAVHPSLSDNLGGAAESLLHGIPTVTTNVGGFPDLIAHGKTGLMVPPRSPEELAAAIGTLLLDREKAAALAASGRTHARKLLDVRRTARAVLETYQWILASVSGTRSSPTPIKQGAATAQM